MKFGYKAKAMFSGAVYFRDTLRNDTPERKEKFGGLFSFPPSQKLMKKIEKYFRYDWKK